LENAVRVGGRTIMSVAGRMVVIGAVMMRLRRLLENMVHLMRCRI